MSGVTWLLFLVFLVALAQLVQLFLFYSRAGERHDVRGPQASFTTTAVMSSSEPIDAVYTWVNGSDPKFLEELHHYRALFESEYPEEEQSGSNGRNTSSVSKANRFRDNEELRYSLRSLEKYAPWIRHVYIVTNGQVPSWLNLENERVSIVKHQDIFTNKDHLPTFSSPAIESHIHRIPGLSEHFIYLNDDVFFGAPVYPDDFYTQSRGPRVFLTWPVPDCSPMCSDSWIGDSYCDLSCNISACNFDGGDCDATETPSNAMGNIGSLDEWSSSDDESITNSRNQHVFEDDDVGVDRDDDDILSLSGLSTVDYGGDDDGLEGSTRSIQDSSAGFRCDPICHSKWIGDKMCDEACDVELCGFDAGDCPGFNQNMAEKLASSITVVKGVQIRSKKLLNSTDLVKETTQVRGSMIGSTSMVLSWPPRDVVVFDISNYFLPVLDVITNVQILTKGSDPKWYHLFTASENSMVFALLAASENDVLRKSRGILESSSNKDGQVDSFTVRITGTLHKSSHKATTDGRNSKTSTGNMKRNWPRSESGAQHMQLPTLAILDINIQFNTSTNFTIPKRKQRISSRKTEEYENDQDNHSSWDTQFSFGKDPNLDEDSVSPDDGKLDTFGGSLRFVSLLLNERYGRPVDQRRVPAHMPHFMEKGKLKTIHEIWQKEFEQTSSHRFRHHNDMQFAFTYFSFVMNENPEFRLQDLWEYFDRDQDGELSDNEFRTLALILIPPVTNDFDDDAMGQVDDTEVRIAELKQSFLTNSIGSLFSKRFTRDVFFKADSAAIQQLVNNLGPLTHAKYEEANVEDMVSFIMVRNNSTNQMRKFDGIRRKQTKFVCVNDDVEESSGEVSHALHDLFTALLPLPSQFELPAHKSNPWTRLPDDWTMQSKQRGVRGLQQGNKQHMDGTVVDDSRQYAVRVAPPSRFNFTRWSFGTKVIALGLLGCIVVMLVSATPTTATKRRRRRMSKPHAV